MATSLPNFQTEEILQGSLPRRRIRLHNDSDLPFWPNRLHGLLQGSDPRRHDTATNMEQGRRGKALQILQR